MKMLVRLAVYFAVYFGHCIRMRKIPESTYYHILTDIVLLIQMKEKKFEGK